MRDYEEGLDEFLKQNNATQYKTQVRSLMSLGYKMDMALEMVKVKDTFVDYLRTIESADVLNFPLVWKIAQGMSGQAYWNLFVEWAYRGGTIFSEEESNLCANSRGSWTEAYRNLPTEEFFVSLFVRKLVEKMK